MFEGTLVGTWRCFAGSEPVFPVLTRLWRQRGSSPPRSKALTSVTLQATVSHVKIRGFLHKGLRLLYADDSTKGVPPASADKLRKMLAFLDNMEDPEELRTLPAWRTHTLTGPRKGTWSLSVTRNLRLTFKVDVAEHEVNDINLEDYH